MNLPASAAVDRLPVALVGERVLVLAGVTPAFSAVYSAYSPMWQQPNESQSPSWIMPSTIVWLPALIPLAHAVDVVRRAGHRLLPAGDDALGVARLDRLRGEHHRLEAGAADLVDGERRESSAGDRRGSAPGARAPGPSRPAPPGP